MWGEGREGPLCSGLPKDGHRVGGSRSIAQRGAIAISQELIRAGGRAVQCPWPKEGGVSTSLLLPTEPRSGLALALFSDQFIKAMAALSPSSLGAG